MKFMRFLLPLFCLLPLFSVEVFARPGILGNNGRDLQNLYNRATGQLESAVWKNECDEGIQATPVVQFNDNPLEKVETPGQIRMFSGIGALFYENEKAPLRSGTTFLFKRPGSSEIYVAASAHQVFRLGKPVLGQDVNGEDIEFFSDICRDSYAVKKGSVRVLTTDIDSKQMNKNRDKDLLVFKLASNPCPNAKVYNLATDEQLQKSKMGKFNVIVAGTYTTNRDTKTASSESLTPSTQFGFEKMFSVCDLKGTEKLNNSTMLYYGCDTDSGGSGGPVFHVDEKGEPSVLGVHRGPSTTSLSRKSNEAVRLSESVVSNLYK